MTAKRTEYCFDDHQLENLIRYLADRYGYDFSDYARSSIRRRVNRLICSEYSGDWQFFWQKLTDSTSPAPIQSLIHDISVGVTEFFRDPAFFTVIHEQVLPVLATFPSLKVWIAGCSTGEEAISIAILLHHAKLLDRTTIYATDYDPVAISTASKGVFGTRSYLTFQERLAEIAPTMKTDYLFEDAGGRKQVAEHIRNKIVFAQHNLVSDDVFVEAQLVLCRNVLIYFNKSLQSKVLEKFSRSLSRHGFLCLGSQENLISDPQITGKLTAEFEQERIFVKKNSLL